MYFFSAACMWSICQSSAKCYTGSDIRTLEGLHYETGFLIWFLRTESLVKKERSCFRLCCWFRGGEKTVLYKQRRWTGRCCMILSLNLYHCCRQRRKCHDLRCQITQFNVTRVIIVTFAGADGEMFVSRDYNYNHSVIRKRSVVLFDWPPCWNHFTALCCIFSKRHQPAHNRTQVHNVKLEL